MMAVILRILTPLVMAIGLAAFDGAAAQSIDSPELGRPGEYVVGTMNREMTLPSRMQLTTNGAAPAERKVGLRWWYPANDKNGKPVVYRHGLNLPDKSAHEVVEQGVAYEGVSAVKGNFPLVVISHGFGGWSEHLSRLGEHLASRGYVVAAIDHRDAPFDSLPGFLVSFGNVLINRSVDQRQILELLLDPKAADTDRLLSSVDKGKVALIGYSMGGYGALATAGAPYDSNASPFAQFPAAAKATFISSGPDVAERVKALILIAPWGGQPDSRAWSGASLAALKAPTLMISGDRDDIVDFARGVRWLFDTISSADRYLLVYREARHNVAGNAVDAGSVRSSEAVGYLLEPVWRQDRINQINQHFVTAFLDVMLKGQSAKRSYLDVPVPVASDGKWLAGFGTTDGGAVAGDGQPGYWRGFQKRWATGLEFHHKTATRDRETGAK